MSVQITGGTGMHSHGGKRKILLKPLKVRRSNGCTSIHDAFHRCSGYRALSELSNHRGHAATRLINVDKENNKHEPAQLSDIFRSTQSRITHQSVTTSHTE